MTERLEPLETALADRYTIERELGRGGMATVYLAEDRKHGRRVAVKVLHPELAATLGHDRFTREIEIAAQLTHPHILPLHDSGEADGFLYYVMPFIEGESLRDRLNREGKIAVEEAIRLTDQIAVALSYAHEMGVIHRDIKPENVLLVGDRALVADFGIARAVTAAGDERLTETGLAIGTPAYMSPEQAFADEDIDGRADVYALGCVVYEMVAGDPPFAGDTPQTVVARHAADTVPGLRTHDRAIPLYVERAVEKALAKNPDQRFPTPSAFAEALTTGTVVRRVRGRRRRTLIGAMAASVVVAGGATSLWIASTAGDRQIERLAVLPPSTLTDPAGQEHIIAGVHNALITELSHAGVTVIGGLQSMARYRDTDKSVTEIAAELSVDAVVEPSVFWTGDSVAIDVRLIDGRTQESLWSQSYSADARNVLALYRDVTRGIASEIQLALTPEIEARLTTDDPVDPQAHEAYLRGQFHAAKLTRADLETAMDYFQTALAIQEDYAPAYAGIAWTRTAQKQVGLVSHGVAAPRARAAALRAVELDPTLAEAHHAVATGIGWMEWDWELSERSLRRSLALNPNYTDARNDYSHLLLVLRRFDEAVAQADTAMALDPYNVKSRVFRGIVILQGLRRYDEAIAEFETVLRTVPNHPVAIAGLHQAYNALGRHDRAFEYLRESYRIRGDAPVVEALNDGYAEDGYRGAALAAAKILEERSGGENVPGPPVASLYAVARQAEPTLTWLERAVDARDPNMPYIGVTPLNEFLYDHPRFQNLLRRMNLPTQ